MTTKLSPQQQSILDILGVNGGWMEQHEIAHQLGKEMLSPDDVTQLDLLEYSGFVIKETSDDSSPEGETRRYRIAEPKVELRNHGST